MLLREPALCVAFEALEPPWASQLRRRLKALDATCAWQYCLAVRCLEPEAWGESCPDGLVPLEEAWKVQEYGILWDFRPSSMEFRAVFGWF